jgi:hypothetical protein
MLLDTPYKNGDVVTLKLSSGEELIGRLEEEKADAYLIKTPLTLVMAQQGLGMQQYMFTADPDKKVPFAKNHVTVITKTGKQFAEAYQQQTSGLVTAPAGLGDALKTK